MHFSVAEGFALKASASVEAHAGETDRKAWTVLMILGIVLIIAGVAISVAVFGHRDPLLLSVSTGLLTGGLVLVFLSIVRPPRRW